MKHSLGYQVLVAVVLGIFAGFFFGPLTQVLEPVGQSYTMLLQMAVLPYICFSLIHGLGSMTPQVGKKLFKSGWPYLLTLWLILFAIIVLLIQMIPVAIAPLIKATATGGLASDFSSNFLVYLIPQNPFYDVSHNIVPALAIFGLIGGIALMHIEKKEPLIETLERINQTIEKIFYWLGLLAPIAAFVYVAIAFGTIHFEDLPKIGVYITTFLLTTFFVTFWILPTLLSTLTPLTFREALSGIKFVCLLPLATGLTTVAFPFLNIYLKKLSEKHETHNQFRRTSQTVLPIAYSFGNIGNIMCLFLVFFLSFYFRHPFSGSEKTLLSILTIPLSIGASTNTLSSTLFLIQQIGLPEGAVNLFLELKAVTYHFQVMMSIGGVFTLLILTLYSYYGLIRIQWKALAIRLALSFAAIAVCVFSAKVAFPFRDNYLDLYMSRKIADVIPNPELIQILSPDDPAAPSESDSPLQQILGTRVLKVGFNDESIPYCYYNNQHELVGYDIAYAYQLARDLHCKLEFVPFSFDHLVSDIQEGVFDIGMSSIIMSEDRIVQMNFTFPYAQENNVLIVPVKKKKEFLDLNNVKQMKGLRIGGDGIQTLLAKRYFPNAQIFNKKSMEPLLHGEVDAVIWSASSAFVWCLSHPEYVAIEYGDLIGVGYFGYPVKQSATDLTFLLNNWLALKEQSGFKKAMQSYWIDGLSPEKPKPRWSILRNILHFNE